MPPLDSRGKEPTTQPGETPAGSAPKATRLKRLGAYARAHWKELLALTLAAIPAAFLLFHKGTQQAAQSALSYPAAMFGGGGASGDGSSSAPGTDSISANGSSPAAPPTLKPPSGLNAYGVLPSVWKKWTEHQKEYWKLHHRLPPAPTSVKGANPRNVPVPSHPPLPGRKKVPPPAPVPPIRPPGPPLPARRLL